ncbi:hypothetical protein VB796_21380 [Arcicella sp. LKC2W]|uniref:hypothetical protein n=1 Tax=Arcicella sp. LKC2W TaxID=2984198 RepID=UPI002B20BDC1|nr:hypothetical protein [Arcicella sp. LKC2W]MEA5461634.1 hypothetical protein [Arcicella sp. LKC2W]
MNLNKEKTFEIKYLRDIDKGIQTGKYLIIGSLSFCFLIVLTTLILYKQAVIAQKPQPYIMDRNGEIRKVYDIYNDGFETLEKKAIVTKAHELFFRLEPDEQQIHRNIQKSFYYADFIPLYEFYNSQNYYNNLVQRNAIQYIKTDSIAFHNEWGRFYGKMLIRGQGGVTKENSLITEFQVEKRDRTDNNLYGYYLNKLKIVENKEISSRGIKGNHF